MRVSSRCGAARLLNASPDVCSQCFHSESPVGRSYSRSGINFETNIQRHVGQMQQIVQSFVRNVWNEVFDMFSCSCRLSGFVFDHGFVVHPMGPLHRNSNTCSACNVIWHTMLGNNG